MAIEKIEIHAIFWGERDYSNDMIKYVTFLVLVLIFSIYLFGAPSLFPTAPVGALQSDEPADIEDPHRRAYFTDLTREEVLMHYQTQSQFYFFGIPFKPYRLNYPPEEAATIIRDQTRSTFLEELVTPFRESLFINGFEPKEKKDAVIINGIHYRQKIIVKKVESPQFMRIAIFVPALIFFVFLLHRLRDEFRVLLKQ